MTPDRWRRFLRIRLAQEFHISPLDVDRLSVQDINDALAVIEGQSKGKG